MESATATRSTLGIPEQMRTMAAMIIPLGRPATAEEAAGPVLFLCSEHANYVHGQVLNVTGGQIRRHVFLEPSARLPGLAALAVAAALISGCGGGSGGSGSRPAQRRRQPRPHDRRRREHPRRRARRLDHLGLARL